MDLGYSQHIIIGNENLFLSLKKEGGNIVLGNNDKVKVEESTT